VPLSPGHRVGAYEILAPLGAGGMGEVYRARDSKLNRDVGIKVPPESFAADPARVARFTREAQVLASLNHQNIGAIYGLEESSPTRALVLELVEGPTLADLLPRRDGPGLPLEDVIQIGRQIADALQAAHDLGIVHRDLKPANIKVRPDGTVKVLDFGLAKALDAALAPDEASESPTLLPPDRTVAGTIMGTPAYMSPEQAAGRRVDKRTDLWSFGVVLMEMLTGRQVFSGESTSHVLAAILREQPDFTTLPAEIPESIRRLLRRCLEKDPKRRLDSAAAARLELDDAASPAAVGSPSGARARRSAVVLLALTALAGVAFGAIAMWSLGAPPILPPTPTIRFALAPPADLPLELSMQSAARDFAVASDGSFIVYCTTGGRLAVRRLDRLETSTIAGVQGAVMPFLSPDNQWIGFVQNDLSLKKVPVAGGAAITLTSLPVWPRGASWIDDSTIIVGTNSDTTGLLRVPAGGGEPTVLTKPDRARGEEGHLQPFGLAGGRAVLFTVGAADPKDAQIALLDLASGRRSTVLRGGRDAQYVGSGHLIYESGLGMSAIRFDLKEQRVVGDPVRVLDNLAVAPTAALNAAATSTGSLVYATASASPAAKRSLVWIDRQGRETPVGAPIRGYESVRLSPDGQNVAISIRDQQNDIWMWSLARQTLTRLTFDADIDLSPVWTPDGQRVIFSSARAGAYNVYAVAVNATGADVRLTRSANTQLPDSVTPDGKFVIVHEVRPESESDVDRLALRTTAQPAAAAPEPLLRRPFNEWNGEVSPDGSLLAFESGESSGDSGQSEIYISPYPDVTRARWQLSSGGGHAPVWTSGGRELVYIDASTRLTVASIERTGDTVRAVSRTVVAARIYSNLVWRSYDVSADGKRFLCIRQDEGAPTPSMQFTVVQNWFNEVRRVLPTR
jgi:eukaryotic-like serine/threonine-protein kinase